MKNALVIFVKDLRLGNVKTRIAAVTGDEAALIIYQRLLQHTMSVTRVVDAHRFVYYSETLDDNDIFVVEVYQKRLQAKGDLGAKMRTSFEEIFAAGYNKVCIIGSDCLALTPDIIIDAFESLERHDVVVGPAIDGGYYLIGLKDGVKPLFHDIEWSTAAVFDQTMENVAAHQLKYFLLPVLSDVDTIDDLPENWKQEFIVNG